MTRKNHFILSLFFMCLCFVKSVYGLDVVQEWNQATLSAIQSTNANPLIASRALAIAHTAMYDAWACYEDRAIGTRFGDVLRRPASEFTDANKSEAISFAAYRVLLNLFPTQSIDFNNLMTTLGYNPLNNSSDITTPIGIGNVVAADLLNFRQQDGANQLANELNTIGGPYSDYTGYTPSNTYSQLNNPSLWQPLTPTAVFLSPQWGLVIPFALKSGNQFRPDKHPAAYPSNQYLNQAKALLDLSAKLDDRTKSICVYWADGSGTVTPPGHWNVFARYVSTRDHLCLDQNVKLFFALSNALFDAGIAAWDAKRFYNSVRPITAIRFLFNNVTVKAWGGPCQGTQDILGQNWSPYVPTPSFPEYVSGHSTFSAAGAEVLRRFTGSDSFDFSATVLAGSSFIEPGCAPTKDVTLQWKTFSEAADQAGVSRRYGGIHFKDGDHEGRKLGRKVGGTAFDKARYYIMGGGA